MATQEARLLLAELMGSDRNAPLPRGMARPSSKSNSKKKREQEYLRHAHLKKIRKSCYDPDIDPLFTSWGIDVYDLFVNTKSDLGANPYVVDNAAHEEYVNLPTSEKEKLGYDYFLFQKLSELVRSADRTIARNEEKLKVELQRKRSAGRAENLFVEEVDDHALENLCRALVQVELMEQELADKLGSLGELSEKEATLKSELEGLLERKKQLQKQQQQQQKEEEKASVKEAESAKDAGPGAEADGVDADAGKASDPPSPTSAEGSQDAPSTAEGETLGGVDTMEEGTGANKADSAAVPDATATTTTTTTTTQAEGDAVPASDEPSTAAVVVAAVPLSEEEEERLHVLQVELGRHTLERQVLLHRIAALTRQLVPTYDDLHSHKRHLLTVRNDITTDKTVCHVSGNFLSARDADERIAAHYAGKQYQGWRLVRDKLKELQRSHGRYGPPPPTGGGSRGSLSSDPGRNLPPPRGPPSLPSSGPPRGGGGGGGGGYGGRSGGSGGGGDRGGPPGRYDDGRYGGGGGGGGYGGPPPRSGGGGGGSGSGSGGGRWERHGPQPPSSYGGGGGGDRSSGSSYSRGGGGGGGGSWRR